MISFTQWKYVQPCETWWTWCTLFKNTQTCQIFNSANLESPKISQTHHVTLVGLADNRKQRQNEHLNAYFLVKIVCHGPKQLATKKRASEDSLFSFTWDLKAPPKWLRKLSGYGAVLQQVLLRHSSSALLQNLCPNQYQWREHSLLMVWPGWQRKSNNCNHFRTLKTEFYDWPSAH